MTPDVAFLNPDDHLNLQVNWGRWETPESVVASGEKKGNSFAFSSLIGTRCKLSLV